MTRTYQVISYDVWGNPKDGFEVNDQYTTSYRITLPDNPTDKEILTALYKSGYASRDILNGKMSIEGRLNSTLYIYHIGQSVRGYKPFCELQALKEE